MNKINDSFSFPENTPLKNIKRGLEEIIEDKTIEKKEEKEKKEKDIKDILEFPDVLSAVSRVPSYKVPQIDPIYRTNNNQNQNHSGNHNHDSNTNGTIEIRDVYVPRDQQIPPHTQDNVDVFVKTQNNNYRQVKLPNGKVITMCNFAGDQYILNDNIK
ncbi:MAG: hypothetical protein ABDH21_06765 [bacterium]